MKTKHIFFLSVCALLWLSACQASSAPAAPTVVIVAPAHGSTFTAGETVAVQSSAADATGVSRVELVVDNVAVKQDVPPSLPAPVQFTVIQNWTATEGEHTLMVRATNPAGVVGQNAVTVNIKPQAASIAPNTIVATVTPLSTIAQAAPTVAMATTMPVNSPAPLATVCKFDSKFVADVSIPDDTRLAPGQAFQKSWRVLNSGNCAWQNGAALVFVQGQALGGNNAVALPIVNPGQMTDIAIPMQAPTAPGNYSAIWRMRDANGNLFGTQLIVRIIVPAPTTSAACASAPADFDFAASAASINKGETVTLSWGSVNNATGAFLSGGEFNNTGVETPGSRNVRPATTTTYVLRALCAPSGQTRDKSVTIRVNDVANQGPLNGNFEILADGDDSTTDVVHGSLVFRAMAGDIEASCQGADGCNIEHVDLFIYDPNGKLVHQRTERNVKYCAFGGGDNGASCPAYVFFDHNGRWDDAAKTPIIDGGEYRLYAEAFSKDGRKKTIEKFVTINF